MNYREVEIFAPKDLGPAGTEVIDIKVKDALSAIELIWQTTVVTTALMLAPHVACISRIELVDGSDVLVGLSGEEAQALAFYSTGKMPLNLVSVVVGGYMKSVIPIYFGRKLFDRELALDPKQFSNLQLKVTWDEDTANTAVTVNKLTVRGTVFDKRPVSPRGFLMSKEIKSYTPAANTYEYTKLPIDFPYRLLMLRSKSTTLEPNAALNQVKLDEGTDKRVSLDMTGDEVLQKIVVPMGEVEEDYKLAGSIAASTIYGAPTAGVRVMKDIEKITGAVTDTLAPILIANNKYSVVAAVAGYYHSFLARGYAPHSCLAIPMGDPGVIEDWYDPKDVGDLRLTTQGAADVGTTPSAQVVIQQLRGL
ncbi:MAG: hypothetical protein KKF27_21055 [Gammaproteobacteria bacterium]|nr:hypothetical protein [Gammaproteobacteria bacterium]